MNGIENAAPVQSGAPGGYQGRSFNNTNANNGGAFNNGNSGGGYRGGFGGNSGGGYRGRGGGGGYNAGAGNGGAFASRAAPGGGGGGNNYHREEKPEEEIFKEHSAGINFDLYEAIKVSITPNDVPPTETFEEMGLAPALNENVIRCRYTKPTPVQKYGIPPVLKGSDMMACAQTGSGKTAAFLMPAINFMLVNNLNRAQQTNGAATPSALVMAPTRELSIQIYEEGRKFTFRTGIRCVVVYGGADPRHQIYELTRGCGLLVATPGRLWDMYSRGYARFSSIRFLVLDEADRMLDMGFEPQIRQIVQGPESDMPRPDGRQTLLYSATFPKEIQQLAREFLNRYYFLQVGRVGSTTEMITQECRWVEDAQKRDMLLTILNAHENERVLVFVEKKRDADYLERFLRQNNYACTSIHGDRVQREREEALNLFKSGVCRVLVATDVASRGLDIPNVSAVVQYDLPSNIDDYVHRIGRTGRAGKTGLAIAFFNDKNKNIVDELIPLLKETNQPIIPEMQALAKKPNFNSNAYGRGRGRGRGFGGNPFGARNNGGGGFGGGGAGGYRGGRGGGGGGYGGGYNNGGGYGGGGAGMPGAGAGAGAPSAPIAGGGGYANGGGYNSGVSPVPAPRGGYSGGYANGGGYGGGYNNGGAPAGGPVRDGMFGQRTQQ